MSSSTFERMDERKRLRKRFLLGALAIALLTIIAYYHVPANGFIWDDESYIQNNQLLHDIDGLGKIWIPKQTPQYYPVAFSSFWLEYQLWELEPTGYHVTNIVLHVLNAILLWLICIRLKFPPGAGWLVAALFALHPVHMESVAWITERKNVLSAFFYLSAALTYLHFSSILDGEHEDKPRNEAWGWYGVSIFLFILALLSKSVTCSLPAALILVRLYQRKAFTPAKIMLLLPMFILGLLAAMNTASIETTHVGAEGVEFSFSFIERMIIASKALLFYPTKILWPASLMFNYPRWSIDAGSAMSYLPVLIVTMIGAGLLLLYFRGRRGPFIALSFYAGTVFPALGFFNVYPHKFSFVADHFQYLASIGVIVLVVGIAQHLMANAKKLLLLGIIPLVIFIPLSWRQSGDYYDLETLWVNTLSRNPDAWMPHNNLSSIFLRRADEKLRAGENAEVEIEAARSHARHAVDIKPGHHTAHSNLSEALRLQNRLPEALVQITLACEAHPIWPHHHRNQGRLLELLQRPDEAIDAYQRAVSAGPSLIPARLDLARLLVGSGDVEGAARQYENVLKIDSRNFNALGTLANIRAQTGQYDEADTLYDRALTAAPGPQEQISIAMRQVVFLINCPDPQVANLDKAAFIAERVTTATNRSLPNTLDVLAMVYGAQGRFEQAIATQEQAIALARNLGLTQVFDEFQTRLDAYRRGETVAPTRPTTSDTTSDQ